MIAFNQFFKLASSCAAPLFPGGPSLYDHLCSGRNVKLQALSDIWVLVGNVVRILLALAGMLAVAFIIVGGIYYVMSAGDPGRVKRGKEIVTYAVVGLVLSISAYALVTFVAGRFGA